MDKNVDQGSAVECTAAHHRLTKSPEEEEKSVYVFFCIGPYISNGREIRCLPYAGFFFLNKKDMTFLVVLKDTEKISQKCCCHNFKSYSVRVV